MSMISRTLSGSASNLVASSTFMIPPNMLSGFQSGLEALGLSAALTNGALDAQILQQQLPSLLENGRLASLGVPAETVQSLRQFAKDGNFTEQVVVHLGTLIAAQSVAATFEPEDLAAIVRSDRRPETDTDIHDERLTLSAHVQAQFLQNLILQSGLADGREWSTEAGVHAIGGATRVARQTQADAPVLAVAASTFDARRILPDTLRGNRRGMDSILKAYFTARELDQDNLGMVQGSLDQTKFFSRVAGILALKAATFRAAGLALPGEKGGEHLKWTDVEYAREAYTESGGQVRYRRVRNFSGEVEKALSGRGLFANFTDEGNTGSAVVVLERERGASGIVSIGIDITDARRFSSEREAAAHARGETAYKLTYFGGHQTFYLDNIVGEIIPGEVLAAGRRRFGFQGLTQQALRNLGGSEVIGAEVHLGRLVGAIMVARGEPVDGERSLVDGASPAEGARRDSSQGRSPSPGQPNRQTPQNAGQIPAPLEVRPALAQMINNGDVNVIYALPGQASEYAPWLIDRFQKSPVAQEVMKAQAANLKNKHGIDLLALVSGGAASSDLLASSAYSQPLIGLAQAVINAELKALGYDLTKAVVIGHSQGQVMGLHAVGALSDDEVIDFLAVNGKLMQESDPLFSPQVGDPLNLMKVVTADSADMVETMNRYTGKISMITTLGISREDLQTLVDDVNQDLNKDLADGEAGELAQISLINVEPGVKHADLAPEGFQPHAAVEKTGIIISGTTDALKEVARRVQARGQLFGRPYKVRALPTTAAFHSKLMEPALTAVWPRLVGRKFGDIPTAVLMNHDGSDLRDITGTVKRTGPDGTEYEIDARIAAVMEGQYVRPVNWPTVVWNAFSRIDFSKPTVVIDGGPGAATGKFIEGNLTDANGRSPITVVSYGTPQGEAVLRSGDAKSIPLVDPRTFTDPVFKPTLAQADKGAPILNGDYTGPYAYLAHVRLADPVQRRDLIARLEKALNLDKEGPPHLRSEFMDTLGYDSSMPLVVAGMTGNNGVDLIASLATDHYLGFYAATTVGFDFAALARDLRAIHEQTKERLRAKGDPNWEQGAPFGVNFIHGTGSFKTQIQEVIKAKRDGVPINIVSIAFSLIQLPEWKQFYQPLLDLGIAVLPLGENEGRWDHFLEEIYPEVPAHQRHLLSIAPEGAEGGGHNIPHDAPNIRYGRDLTLSLLKRGALKNDEKGVAPLPWFMTGGQTTPEAMADALLVMAQQSNRGGMQVGGIMQLASESIPPPQVKAFIAEAAAGQVGFVQAQSEFERAINMLDNRFGRNFESMTSLMKNVPQRDVDVPQADGTTKKNRIQDPVGRERAEKIAELFLQEPAEQRQVLHRLWLQGMNAFNRAQFQPLVDTVWPLWLAGDFEPLAARLAELTPRDVIAMYRTYRTWAVMEPDIDPSSAYVLGGKSIRAMGRALEREGQDPKKYLMMSAPEIFRDLRDRTIRYLTDLHQRAMAIEEAERDNYRVSSTETFQSVSGVKHVREESLGEGETSLIVEIGKDLNHSEWLLAVQASGHGSLARALRSNEVGLGDKEGNPLHRTLAVERGDRVELTRHEEAGKTLLDRVRIFNRSGRLIAEISPSSDQKSIQETWNLAQPGGDPSPVTWRYDVKTGLAGGKKIAAAPGGTAAQGREAYIRLWVGAEAQPTPLGERATAKWDVTQSDVLAWHRQVGATSRTYSNPRAKGFQVHATYPLKAAWPSMMQVGMDSAAGIDFLKVVHSGQSMRVVRPIRIGDQLTAASQMVRVEDHAYGREATIVTQVTDQKGEVVAEYETKFLSRASNDKASVIFEAPVERSLAPKTPEIKVRPLEVYRREKMSLRREDITGYALDAQWLHTDDRFARRVGFKNGIIAQGWRILHSVSHSLVEGYLKNDASRFIGFGEGTAVTAPVLPGEELNLEVDRIGIRGDREVLAFRLVPDGGGSPKASGTIELRLPQYAGVFPGNASQKVGMAKDLYLAGGIGRATLIEATTALGEEGTLLLDIMTGGASLPEGDAARQAAYDQTDKDDKKGWLNDVVNSSPAVLATSEAYRRQRTSDGFPQPATVSGHSLGQYTAAVAAGALELGEAMRLVRTRGELMRKHAQGKIAVVMVPNRLDPEDLQKRLAGIRQEGETLEVANINTITDKGSQVAISGTEAAILRAQQELSKDEGTKVSVMAGNVAFHSSLVRAMEPEFRQVMDGVTVQDPQIPVSSIVEPGRFLKTAAEVREELIILNHESVRWDPNVRAVAGGVASFVEFGAGTILTGMIGRIRPDRARGSVSQSKGADELIFGDRPRPKMAAVAAKPAVAPAAAPAVPAAQAQAPVSLEPAPSPYTTADMAVLDLRLSSARVVLDGESVASVALSPLAPKLGSSPSEFLWANLVISLSEAKPGVVKPSELTPDTNLAKDIGLDSLDVATFFGWVRNRNFISRMPTNDEVKSLEQGTLRDAFALAVSYWDHPGEKPGIDQRGTIGAAGGKTYKEILEAAGIKGDEVNKLVANGKLTHEAAGVEAIVQTVLGEANEGAAAGVGDHVKRLEGWTYSDNFASQAQNLRTVKTSLYQAAQAGWNQRRSDREARNASAQAQAARPMQGMMMPAAASSGASVDPKEVEAIARRVTAQMMRESQGAGHASRTAEIPVEFDEVTGKIVAEGQVAAAREHRTLEAVRAETSGRFISKLESKWSGRVHQPWANAAQNGAPENLMRLFREVSAGTLDPSSEFGQARMQHVANQMDEARIDYARRLARRAERRGLENVQQALNQVIAMAERSLEMEKQGQYHLPIVWDVRHRNMSPAQFVDHLMHSNQIDAKTAQDLRAMIAGETNFVGKKVMIYGGTGTISSPTVKFFLQLGADVWITTRQDFGKVEKAAAKLRNENAVRVNSLQVSTQWTPNYRNVDALTEQHKKQNWKPDFIINGMAAEDYGPVNAQGDFEMVMRTLVGDFRYAVGQYIDWYKNDPNGSPTLTAHNQFSPQHQYMIKMSQHYINAKAAYRPTYWAERRQAEKLVYADGRPIVRGVSLETGLVVEDETPAHQRDKSITGQFSPLRREFEEAAAEHNIPLTVFSSEEFGPINVAPFNPTHGIEDQTDRIADGGFGAAGRLEGGIETLSNRASELKHQKTAEPAARPGQEGQRTPTGWHPYHDGGITTVTDYAFHIKSEDPAETPFNDIGDEDLVIVGVGAVSTFGGTLPDTAMNLWQTRGDFVGPWGENLGLVGVANYIGMNTSGLTPDQMTQDQIQKVLSDMGSRLLTRGNQRADRRTRQERYQESDEILLGPIDLVQKNADLKKKLRMYRDSGYRLVKREEFDTSGQKVQMAWVVKDKARKTREVVDPLGPQVMADIPHFDWNRLGANTEVVDLHGRNVLISGLSLTEAVRQMGLVPPQVVQRHGRNNVYVIGSDGMGPLQLIGDQHVKQAFGEDPGEKAVVLGIPSAKAGRIAADHFGTMAPASDTPAACNTGPHSMWNAVQQIRARFYEADQLRQQAERLPEGSSQSRVLQARADRMRRDALKSAILVTTADDGATMNTMGLFDRVGAMLTQASADAKEFPIDGQQRPHDAGRIAQFQSGVGGAALMITTGRMMREQGYRPVAKLTSVKVGTDGSTREPDGKPRAWTGLGRWGQRNVFFQGLRAARNAGVTLSNVYQMNSHSTGTGGDGTQSESFVIGAVSEAVENAVFNLSYGSDEYAGMAALLSQKGIDPAKYYAEDGPLAEKDGLEISEQILRDLGLSLDDPKKLMVEVRSWPLELKEELGIDALISESHAKGSGVRHTLGGTLLEFALLLTQAIERRTLPHSYLNNLIEATADSPLATTYRNVQDLAPVVGRRPRYSSRPDQVGEVRNGRRRHVVAVAGNSFGFNGHDGFEVAEIAEGLNFSSREEAVDMFANMIRSEANDIAQHRATREGKQNAIQYSDSGHVDATAYADTKDGFERARELAERIVNRDPDLVLPWQQMPAWLKDQKEAS